jgi:hypothetical protein
MTRKQAENLKADLEKTITLDDYVEDLYISINGVGSKVFKNCVYLEAEGWLFIWTYEESYMIRRKDIGECVIAPASFYTIFNCSIK